MLVRGFSVLMIICLHLRFVKILERLESCVSELLFSTSTTHIPFRSVHIPFFTLERSGCGQTFSCRSVDSFSLGSNFILSTQELRLFIFFYWVCFLWIEILSCLQLQLSDWLYFMSYVQLFGILCLQWDSLSPVNWAICSSPELWNVYTIQLIRFLFYLSIVPFYNVPVSVSPSLLGCFISSSC